MTRGAWGAAWLLAWATAIPAQEPADQKQPFFDFGYFHSRPEGDIVEWIFTGGISYERDGLAIRAENAVFVLDRQESAGVIASETASGLPRRPLVLPRAGRAVDEGVLRARLRAFLSAASRGEPPRSLPDDLRLELLRSAYLEGGVTIAQDGIEVARADRVFFSVIDDRAVFHDVTLRLVTTTRDRGEQALVVRSDRLVRQGTRITGRDVSVTTCTAGRPHYEVFSGEVEILERGDEFEIRSRDNFLAVGGARVLPLPSVTHFTADQNQLLIQSASISYSSRERVDAEIVLGSNFNELGGSVHSFVTGRDASEFRGDWELGLGFIETRGAPLRPALEYRADGLYSGRTEAFHLSDRGRNIREIRRNLDGSPIDERERGLLSSENRVHLGRNTTLDLTAFDASDPAVYSEFYSGNYYGDEIPESSIHARHASRNYVATLTGRFNAAGFSYADGRNLADRFVEERPHLTFDWFSEPLATLPGDTPLLLTTSTGIASLASDFDAHATSPIDDELLRVDQEVELAAPFLVGPAGLRPFARARFTRYDETRAGGELDRWAFDAGVSLGTRLSRAWRSIGESGETTRIVRHVASPTIEFAHRFKVDGEPGDLFAFDAVDAMDEGANIRVGLLQRVERDVISGPDSTRSSAGSVWLDLAQNVTPVADRDNQGHHLGLFEFELILRPARDWLGIPNLALVTEGEHDWDDSELRTFNNSVRFDAADVTWIGEYRADRTERGRVGYGAIVPIRSRWELFGFSRYDLERSEHVNYTTRLVRTDHDWRITLSLTFNEITDDTSFNFEFEPRLAGAFRRNPRRFVGSADWGGPEHADW